MPVFVVENQRHGNTGFCNLYEGESRRRLNYGVYDDEVAGGLRFLERTVAPILGAAVRRAGGVPLKPLMARAVRMGDELHCAQHRGDDAADQGARAAVRRPCRRRRVRR